MPRTISVSVDPQHTQPLVSALERNEGVVSVQVHRGVSVKPPGDQVLALVANTHIFEVMRLLEREIPRPNNLTLSQPDAAYTASGQDKIDADIIESIWEETELTLQRTSSTDFNFIMLMAFAGVIAAVGLSTGVLHLVIAAMLVVPGFQPIVNIPLGIVLKNSRLIRLGLRSTLLGYAIFTTAAVLAFHFLRLTGNTSIPAFIAMPMVHYWTSFSVSSIMIQTIAAAAGVTIIPTHRSVLTAGVMVALSLVPGAAIFGISLSGGHWEFALRGLLQWLANVIAILLTGVLIFGLKQAYVHGRNAWH